MKKIELLAPAGNMECLIAAINAGCDAIYIGGKQFGARAFSNNFTDNELVEAIKYAHLYGVKIYVTVNTLIYENEVNEFIEYVRFLHTNNVDALIMQDIGMIDLVTKKFPNLEVHASTQCHVHNLDGVNVMKSMGVKRVVLARETSIEQIKHIKDNSDIDLEIFVHGALCMSYSGQCLMSSLIGNRSGNRGTCAQCCRLSYDLYSDNIKVNKDKYLLSTKDLCTIENIGKLIDIGVTSLKIEGRMKRKEYVYLVVSLYRKAIDSYYKLGYVYISDKDILELKKIFNRDFTKGYIFNEELIVNQYRPNHLGIKIGKIINIINNKVYVKLTNNVSKQDGIRILSKVDVGLTLINFYKNDVKVTEAYKNDVIYFYLKEKVFVDDKVVKTTDIKQLNDINNKLKIKKKINIDFNIEVKDLLYITITDGINTISKSYDIVENSINNPITKEAIIKQMSKLGNTIYSINKISINLDNNKFINIKQLNEARRKITDLLNDKRLYQIPFKELDYSINLPNFKIEKNTNYKIYNIEQYNKYKNISHNIYSDTLINNTIYITPRVIDKYNYDLAMVSEIGGINLKNYYTDAFLNVTNSYSLAFLHSKGSKLVTLSYELTYNQVKDIIVSYKKRYNKNPNCEVVVYGFIEAMITKYDMLKHFNINNGYLKDIKGRKFKLRKLNNYMLVYNYEIRDLKDNYLEIVNNIRYDLNKID